MTRNPLKTLARLAVVVAAAAAVTLAVAGPAAAQTDTSDPDACDKAGGQWVAERTVNGETIPARCTGVWGNTTQVQSSIDDFWDSGAGFFLAQAGLWIGIAIMVFALVSNGAKLARGGAGGMGGGGVGQFVKGLIPAALAGILLMNLQTTWNAVAGLGRLVGGIFDFIGELLGAGGL